jgi:tetratricopeptide (TPR) repeat protein
MAQGKAALARKAYLAALRLDPAFVPAYVNLADLYRALGSDKEGEETLRAGLAEVPESADLNHALGLLHIRRKHLDQALDALARAADLAPERARYAYVYALALQEKGDLEGALAVLGKARKSHPRDRDLLTALATINLDSGDREAALESARALLESYPDDRGAAELVRELQSAGTE